jgi:hypothetical protein
MIKVRMIVVRNMPSHAVRESDIRTETPETSRKEMKNVLYRRSCFRDEKSRKDAAVYIPTALRFENQM